MCGRERRQISLAESSERLCVSGEGRGGAGARCPPVDRLSVHGHILYSQPFPTECVRAA